MYKQTFTELSSKMNSLLDRQMGFSQTTGPTLVYSF